MKLLALLPSRIRASVSLHDFQLKNLLFSSLSMLPFCAFHTLIPVVDIHQNITLHPYLNLCSPGAGWDCGARNARMYFTDDFKTKRVGAWCAATPKNQWLQVDLGTNRYITGVGTQGHTLLKFCFVSHL